MPYKILLSVYLLLHLTQSILAQELAPSFSGVEMRTGQTINLAEYRGKVVFIDFWASWCPPCLLSLPAYEEMRKRIGTEHFEIIAINVDEDSENGIIFLEDHAVSYPVLADPSGVIGIPYGIRSLPVAYLLNRAGQIVSSYRNFKPGDELSLQASIEALIAE